MKFSLILTLLFSIFSSSTFSIEQGKVEITPVKRAYLFMGSHLAPIIKSSEGYLKLRMRLKNDKVLVFYTFYNQMLSNEIPNDLKESANKHVAQVVENLSKIFKIKNINYEIYFEVETI